MYAAFLFGALVALFPAMARAQSGIDFSEQLLRARGLQQAGQYNAARSVLLETLTKAPDSAILLDALGSVQQDLGEYVEAERSYLRALELSSRSAGDTERLVLLNNLATLYLESAQYEKGSRVREQLEKLTPAILEEQPRAAAILLNVAGSLEHARNRDREAETYYVRSLELFHRTMGPISVDAAVVKINLGGLRLEAGQYQAATDLFQQAIHEIETASNPGNPALIRPLINAARSENLSGHPNLAEPFARRGVELSLQILGESHPVTATAMLEEAMALRGLGHKKPARELEKRAKAGLRARSTAGASGYTVSLRDLGERKAR
jgi:tetratricopeptide (TPR) repeat protein